VTLLDTGTDIRLLVQLEGITHLVNWVAFLPYLYESGAKVIRCDEINTDVPYCNQSGFPLSPDEAKICQWDGDTINLGDCRPGDGTAIHIEAVAL
jgi:hypothetical protein